MKTPDESGPLSDAVAVFDKLATHYKSKFWDVSHYSASIEKFLALIPVKGTILDVACGPGNMARFILDRRPDIRLTGTDLSPNMIRIAAHENPEASFETADSKAIKSTHPGPYDAVLCAFLFPYFTKDEAITFINDVAHILKPRGILYLSVIEDRNSASGIRTGSTGDRIFMNFHEQTYLEEALQMSGLSTLYSETIKNSTQTNTSERDLIIISAKD